MYGPLDRMHARQPCELSGWFDQKDSELEGLLEGCHSRTQLSERRCICSFMFRCILHDMSHHGRSEFLGLN